VLRAPVPRATPDDCGIFPALTTLTPSPDRDTNDAAMRALIGYKLVKAAVQVLLGLGLFGVVLAGHAHALQSLAELLRQNLSQAWALRLASYLVDMATPRHVELTAVALLLDGVLSGVEGWALHTRRWWAEWLVVVAGGSLLPYELYELTRHVRVGRALIFGINLGIVVYLARRALRRGRRK
jgi:uncharacterized membrane protein (DUF2068 family)